MLTTIRWSVGSGLILWAIALGVSLLTDTGSVAEPGETSSGLSITRLARQYPPLVEPALIRAAKANREKVPTELALPSGSPQEIPQPTPLVEPAKVHAMGLDSVQPAVNLADGVTIREEIDFLVELYSVKYGVDPLTLRAIVRCESTDNPWALGKEGERGFGQFLESTFMETPQKIFGWAAAYHPAVNIEAIAWMLQQGRIEEFHALRGCH